MIQQWLIKNYQITITIAALWYTVNRKLTAAPKVARPQHIKQNENERQSYKDHFPLTVATTTSFYINKGVKYIRYWFQDESRFGLFTIKRRRITIKGVKPIGPMQHEFKSYYLYGVAEPITGDSFFLELPRLDTECFQVFLDHFAQYDPDSQHIVVMDRAGAHQGKKLRVPNNITMNFLPPYSPELNPIERLWQELKSQLAWDNFRSLDELADKVAQNINNLSMNQIKSITYYPYIQKAFV